MINYVFALIQVAAVAHVVVMIADMRQRARASDYDVAAFIGVDVGFLRLGAIVAMIVAIAAYAAGHGLHNRRRWGRRLTLVLGFGAVVFGFLSLNNISIIAAIPYSITVLLLIMLYNKQFAAECK